MDNRAGLLRVALRITRKSMVKPAGQCSPLDQYMYRTGIPQTDVTSLYKWKNRSIIGFMTVTLHRWYVAFQGDD